MERKNIHVFISYEPLITKRICIFFPIVCVLPVKTDDSDETTLLKRRSSLLRKKNRCNLCFLKIYIKREGYIHPFQMLKCVSRALMTVIIGLFFCTHVAVGTKVSSDLDQVVLSARPVSENEGFCDAQHLSIKFQTTPLT